MEENADEGAATAPRVPRSAEETVAAEMCAFVREQVAAGTILGEAIRATEAGAYARGWADAIRGGNADASRPPPDSVSALREARGLLGEALAWVNGSWDMSGKRLALLNQIRAFLGERSDREQSEPSSPLDPGEQKT